MIPLRRPILKRLKWWIIRVFKLYDVPDEEMFVEGEKLLAGGQRPPVYSANLLNMKKWYTFVVINDGEFRV